MALCITAGLALGHALPDLFAVLAGLEYASVNLVVAVLIWAMVYPMMVNVDFASLRHIVLAATLAAVVAACATNPVTGRRELALMSEAQEIELGRQTDAEIRKTMGIYNDPEL